MSNNSQDSDDSANMDPDFEVDQDLFMADQLNESGRPDGVNPLDPLDDSDEGQQVRSLKQRDLNLPQVGSHHHNHNRRSDGLENRYSGSSYQKSPKSDENQNPYGDYYSDSSANPSRACSPKPTPAQA